MVVANNRIDNDKKYMSKAGNFDHHAGEVVQCGAHHPMDHIPGFTRSHWMPPLGKCLRHMALVAAIVDEFVGNIKH